MHHAGWYGVLRDAFNAPPHFLLVRDGHGCVRGILPMYRGHSVVTGTHYSSLEGGILADSAAARHALFVAAMALREEPKVRFVHIRGDTGTPPIAVPKVHTVVATDGVEGAWRAIRSTERREIRIARSSGVEVARDERFESISAFYTLYARRMREFGTPVFGSALFVAMRDRLGPQRLRLYAVRHGERYLGGMLCAVHAKRWTDLYGACEHDAPRGANKLLHWRVISDAAESGAVEFDLGRSIPGGGVHRFKQHMGGRDVAYVYGFYARDGRRLDAVLSANSGDTVLQRIWQKLPPILCNWAGPRIRSGLPFL